MAADIEAAFRKLPIAPTPSGAIPYENVIPNIPRQLILMRPVSTANPVVDDNLPPTLRDSKIWHSTAGRPKVTGAATAKKQLDSLGKRAEALVLAIEELSQTALDALNYHEAALMQLKTSARLLWASSMTSEIPELPKNTGKGAPLKEQERKIAWCVAWHYFLLTGKKPTIPDKDGIPYGIFLELLQSIYAALDVKASAAAQGRAVEENWHIAPGLKEKSRVDIGD
jgi:hypothetical protein